MHDVTDILKRTELFREIPDELLLQEILPAGRFQFYGTGQSLIRAQQTANYFAVILSGRVNIVHFFPDGHSSLTTVLTAADVLAADLIYTRTRISPYNAVAADETRVLYFPAELLTTSGAVTEPWRQVMLSALLTLVSHDNMKKEYRLAILSQRGLRARVMSFLVMQANRHKSATITIPFSREELASYLCVDRSALSHELSLMQQEGLITFRKNVFTLHNILPDST